MSRVWIYQDSHQVKKYGEDQASWYVGWYDPDGKKCCKSCGIGSFGQTKAENLRKKREAELTEGTYQKKARTTWEDFRKEYENKVQVRKAPQMRRLMDDALDHFARIIKPKRMSGIKTATIDRYIAVRCKERGKKGGTLLSPASLNKELRHLRAAFRKAFKWRLLPELPDFEFLKERKKLVTYVSPEHFATLYQHCEHGQVPSVQLAYPPGDWWRALIVMGYMTGWRVSDMLGLRRADLDLEVGAAITRADDNKGKRDERVPLHSVVVGHLKKLAGFEERVFPWNASRRVLQEEFARIQEKAGIHLPCHGNHEHSRFCHVYGFHDLRRAFATQNATRLTAPALQELMRHKAFTTTLGYINMARQLDEAVKSLHVPEVLKVKASG
jgi:integrase